MIKLVCIVCPRGCRITVDEKRGNAVGGNLCPRGAAYAISEVTDSRRTVTTTVSIEGAPYCRCPVKSASPIPKGMIFDAMAVINSTVIKAPVKVGDVVIKNICGTGIDIVSTKTL